MKYPYIGEWEGAMTTILFTGEMQGFEMGKIGEYRNDWTESQYKNITTEYLANTYGEVKSKEHAEFIVRLAKVNDIKVWGDEFINNDTCAFVCHRGVLEIHNHNCNKTISRCNLKQITIPLPPECCGIKINNDNGFNFADCKFENNRVNGESEWPKVNDDVVLNEKKGVVKLLPDAQGYYVVAVDGIYTQCKFGELSKPKTPEQELQEDLINIFDSSLDGGHFVDNLLSKYSLAKKPQ